MKYSGLRWFSLIQRQELCPIYTEQNNLDRNLDHNLDQEISSRVNTRSGSQSG